MLAFGSLRRRLGLRSHRRQVAMALNSKDDGISVAAHGITDCHLPSADTVMPDGAPGKGTDL